jgi:uncharacterized protein (TIGR00297 family)
LIETGILFSGIVGVALFSIIASRRGWLSHEMARKLLHIVAIGLSAVSVFLIPERIYITWVVALSLPATFVLVLRGIFREEETGRRSWGILYYHVLFLLLLLFAPHKSLIYYPLIILALADGFAAVAGNYFGRVPVAGLRNKKTIAGSLAFFVTTIFVIFFSRSYLAVDSPLLNQTSGLFLVAAFLALAELLSGKGRDNIWIPILTLYWMLLPVEQSELYVFSVLVGLPLLAFMALKTGVLDRSGAIAACLLGWVMLISPHPEWIGIALCFFIMGSILSKLPGKTSQSDESNRNDLQVFANGLVPVAFMAFYFLTGNQAWILGSICGFGAALSDTASSEIGMRARSRVYSIVNLKTVPRGLSGGVSLPGTIAGLVFAVFVPLFACLLLDSLKVETVLILTLISFFGNLCDSIFGALFQRKYFNENLGVWQDKPTDIKAIKMRGIRFIDNNVVNFMTTATASFLGWIWFSFF